jgi:hypothetical protein
VLKLTMVERGAERRPYGQLGRRVTDEGEQPVIWRGRISVAATALKRRERQRQEGRHS